MTSLKIPRLLNTFFFLSPFFLFFLPHSFFFLYLFFISNAVSSFLCIYGLFGLFCTMVSKELLFLQRRGGMFLETCPPPSLNPFFPIQFIIRHRYRCFMLFARITMAHYFSTPEYGCNDNSITLFVHLNSKKLTVGVGMKTQHWIRKGRVGGE